MIAKNLKIIREKISAKCLETGRDINDITLIAVSKTYPAEAVETAFQEGIKDFGENKAQELTKKAEDVKPDVSWHFIGHLQTNKVKYIINSAEYIHSVDSVKLADEINKRADALNKVQKILLEVNTSKEASKYGIETEEELRSVVEYCRECKNLKVTGLMTMAPYTDDTAVIKKCFSTLRELKDKLNDDGFELTELSMGMSNDYEIAIEEGATMLRIGSAIFGERNYL